MAFQTFFRKRIIRTSVGDLLANLSRLAHQATKKAHFLHGRVRGRGGSGGVLSPLAEQNNANIRQNDGFQDGVGELGGPEFDQKGFEIVHVITYCGGHDVHLVALCLEEGKKEENKSYKRSAKNDRNKNTEKKTF